MPICSAAPSQVQQSGNSSQGCQLLDKKVSPKCLTSLMGIGTHRFRRTQNGAPDLRFGRKGYKSKPGTSTGDSFLHTAYHNIAETLPDQSLYFLFSNFSIYLVGDPLSQCFLIPRPKRVVSSNVWC